MWILVEFDLDQSFPKDEYTAGYNKALEDFKEAIDEEDREEPLVLDMFVIEEIADKLKK